MGLFLFDFCYMLCGLCKSFGYMVIVLFVFVIGIGVNSVIFSFVCGVVFQLLFFDDVDEFVWMIEVIFVVGILFFFFSVFDLCDFVECIVILSDVGFFQSCMYEFFGDGDLGLIYGVCMSVNFFLMFGFEFVFGCNFSVEEDVL